VLKRKCPEHKCPQRECALERKRVESKRAEGKGMKDKCVLAGAQTGAGAPLDRYAQHLTPHIRATSRIKATPRVRACSTPISLPSGEASQKQ
jgi:hypothetical protein